MASATRSAARPSSSRLSSSNRRGGGTPTWITPVTSSPAVSGTEITDPIPRIAEADRSSSGGSWTSSGARESATRAATCWSRATTRSAGTPSVEARSTRSPVPSSVRKIAAASAESTSHSRGTSSSRICSSRPWASAASSSICRPWTISAMCSASWRAACSRKSCSRWRSRSARWLRSRMNTSRMCSSSKATRLSVTSQNSARAVLAHQAALATQRRVVGRGREGGVQPLEVALAVLGQDDHVGHLPAHGLLGGVAERALRLAVPLR